MKTFLILAPLLLIGAVCGADAANDRLTFADLGGIRDFRADGDTGIYIEGSNKQWYYASFFAPCYDLRFHDEVGFVLETSGGLDKFSSILVGGQQCYFKSFDRTEAPR